MDKKSKNQKSEYNIVNSLLSQQGMAMKYQNLLYRNGVVVSFVFTFLCGNIDCDKWYLREENLGLLLFHVTL